MRLGIDFDNTLIQYDAVFYKAALEQGVIPEDLPANKTKVRDYIREQSSDDVWTELQGLVYGRLISEAKTFDGALETLCELRSQGVIIHLISHKTQWPALGPRWNLHAAARIWLAEQNIYCEDSAENLIEQVWFEETRDAKYQRIEMAGCQAFMDDLPEFLLDPQFPRSVQPILFDPGNNVLTDNALPIIRAWRELPRLLQSFELL